MLRLGGMNESLGGKQTKGITTGLSQNLIQTPNKSGSEVWNGFGFGFGFGFGHMHNASQGWRKVQVLKRNISGVLEVVEFQKPRRIKSEN